MKSRMALAIGLVCVGVSSASARDLSNLYDQSVLEQWKPRYERSTTRILNEVILPVLTTEERRRIGGVPRLDFPLLADAPLRGHPLMFYVPPDGARVVMPIFSLKFLDDACIAYAWLQVNGYSLETISEYTAMLRYKAPPRGRHPEPLTALHIPATALSDRRVDELALGHFVTARTWLLLHELGHIYHRHVASSYAQSQRNEQEADEFATRVMRRTPLPPLGILVFFMLDAHWTGYGSKDFDTHPLSGARVRTLAQAVDDRGLAEGLRKLAELLDDPEIRAGFIATGKAADESTLAPRRSGTLPVLASPLGSAASARASFEGRYTGQSMQYSDRQA